MGLSSYWKRAGRVRSDKELRGVLPTATSTPTNCDIPLYKLDPKAAIDPTEILYIMGSTLSRITIAVTTLFQGEADVARVSESAMFA